MNEPTLVSLFVRPLNQLRIPYMVTGGVASVVYGEPRFTRDIDLVIGLHPRDASRFATAWSSEDFNVIHQHTTMRADIYLTGNDPLNAWAFAHAVVRRIDDDEVSLAPIEAVILSKLRYYRIGGSERHLRDIALMLRVSGALVDRAELERWATRLGVVGEWQRSQEFD